EALKTVIAYMLTLDLIRWAINDEGVTAGWLVALIDFEMGPKRTREMLTHLGATLKELGHIYYVNPDEPPRDDDIRTIVEEGIFFAIVDSAAGAYEVSDLDDGKRGDVQKFVRQWIDPLWKAGVGTLQIDHVVKNPDNRGRY